MEDNLKNGKRPKQNYLKNGRRPQFFWKIEDDLNFLKMEGRPNFYLNGRQPNKNAILTNSTVQHRQTDQHNKQKYIGTNEKINQLGCDIIVN